MNTSSDEVREVCPDEVSPDVLPPEDGAEAAMTSMDTSEDEHSFPLMTAEAEGIEHLPSFLASITYENVWVSVLELFPLLFT